MVMRTLLAVGLAIGVVATGDAAAQSGKCKFVRIVEWAVRADRAGIMIDGAINAPRSASLSTPVP